MRVAYLTLSTHLSHGVNCFRSEAPFTLRLSFIPSVANVNPRNHRFFIIPYPFVLSNTPTKYRSSYTATAARGFADRLRFGKESIYFLHLFLKGFWREWKS